MEETVKKRWQVRFDARQYSRLGIASFVIAILAALVVIADISLGMGAKGDSTAVVQSYQALDVWLTWLTALAAFAGIILGLAAVVQKQRKKLFGWVGLVVNGLFLVAIFGLYLVNAVGFMKFALGK